MNQSSKGPKAHNNNSLGQRPRTAATGFEIPESEVQKSIVDYFDLLRGYKALVTNAGMVRPPKDEDGKRRPGLFASPGVPDLIIVSSDFPPACALLIECKRPKVEMAGQVIQKAGTLSRAQKDLADMGAIHVCYSLDDAIAAHKAFLLALSGRRAA